MREYFEALEKDHLAAYAVKSVDSLGRDFEEALCPLRTFFQRDRDRIIHSKAFRRLKHKTQVFLADHSDHVRSRLTHTIEVAQVSRHLARLFRLNEDLAECIALSHDLGHTPFGHAGERVLDDLMAGFGGFEHNQQSKRIVEQVEVRYPNFLGLNLTREVRDGLIKHRTPWDHPDDQEAIQTLEAEIVNLADEIAYNNHDLDDALSTGLIQLNDLDDQVDLWRETRLEVQELYSNLSSFDLKNAVNRLLISKQIRDVFAHSMPLLEQSNGVLIEHENRCVAFSERMRMQNKQLRQFLFDVFYSHPFVVRMNQKGQDIICYLFDRYRKDISLIPKEYRLLHGEDIKPERLISDYISGMTDNFSMTEYFSITCA